jgi:hypothetical protein
VQDQPNKMDLGSDKHVNTYGITNPSKSGIIDSIDKFFTMQGIKGTMNDMMINQQR